MNTKKRVKLDNGESIITKVDTPSIRKAVISLFRKTNKRLVLLVEEAAKPKVFLLVGHNQKTRTIEYQVSDGMDCYRSTSFDFYNLDKAIACFDKICDQGWQSMKNSS